MAPERKKSQTTFGISPLSFPPVPPARPRPANPVSGPNGPPVPLGRLQSQEAGARGHRCHTDVRTPSCPGKRLLSGAARIFQAKPRFGGCHAAVGAALLSRCPFMPGRAVSPDARLTEVRTHGRRRPGPGLSRAVTPGDAPRSPRGCGSPGWAPRGVRVLSGQDRARDSSGGTPGEPSLLPGTWGTALCPGTLGPACAELGRGSRHRVPLGSF